MDDYTKIKRKGFGDIVCPVCRKLILGRKKAQEVMTGAGPGNPFYDWYQAGECWWKRLREWEKECSLCDDPDCDDCENMIAIKRDLGIYKK